MATPTLFYEYRDGTTRSVWTALTYADMIAAGTTILGQGDWVRVLSSNLVYICTSPETFVLVGQGTLPSFGAAGTFRGVSTDFRDGVGIAASDTAATYTIPGSGVRVFGHGKEVNDSGLTVAHVLGGPVASMLTSATTAKLIALGFGGNTAPWKPGTDGPMVVEANVAMSSALTARAFFIGFVGETAGIADAMDPIVTTSSTTITLVADDVCGLLMDASATVAARLYAAHNKANEAATIATTATGVDTGTAFPAAGTYIRLRVEIDAVGTMRCYANNVLISAIASAASTTVALTPVLYIESRASAVKTMLVKSFSAYSLA